MVPGTFAKRLLELLPVSVVTVTDVPVMLTVLLEVSVVVSVAVVEVVPVIVTDV